MPQPTGNMNLNFSMDSKNLYKEESYTDLKFASIRILTPVNTDGSVDESRPLIFYGVTQLMSPQGMVPVQCEIDAKTMAEAIEKLPAAVNEEVKKMVSEAQKQQQDKDSRIVVPGRDLMK